MPLDKQPGRTSPYDKNNTYLPSHFIHDRDAVVRLIIIKILCLSCISPSGKYNIHQVFAAGMQE